MLQNKMLLVWILQPRMHGAWIQNKANFSALRAVRFKGLRCWYTYSGSCWLVCPPHPNLLDKKKASFLMEEFVSDGALKGLILKPVEEGWDDVPTLKMMNSEDMKLMRMTQHQKVWKWFWSLFSCHHLHEPSKQRIIKVGKCWYLRIFGLI